MGGFFGIMADRTGLEPATSGVTGRHSNQLNYRSAKKVSDGCHFMFNLYCVEKKWWAILGSNQ